MDGGFRSHRHFLLLRRLHALAMSQAILDTKEICTALLSSQSLLSAADVDIAGYVEDALQCVLTKHDHRQESFDILALYFTPLSSLSAAHSTHQQSMLKRVIPLIDRVSVWLESVQLHETASLLAFLEVLCAFRQTEITSHWNKVITKLAPLLQRLLRKQKASLSEVESKHVKLLATQQHAIAASSSRTHGKPSQASTAGAAVNSVVLVNVESEKDELLLRITFYLDVIAVLFKSHLRSNLFPSIKVLRETMCLFLTLQNSSSAAAERLFSSLVEALALVVSCEQVDTWSSTLQSVVLDLILALKSLSLPIPSSLFAHLASLGENRVKLADWEDLERSCEEKDVHGIAKALWTKAIFERLCRLYAQLLSCGCSAGYVGFDLTALFALSAALLPLGMDSNTSDPANFIENEQRVSVVDIAFVLANLKISLLGVMQTLLQLNLPGFIRCGGLFVQPVLSLLARRESLAVPDLLVAALSLLRVAACVLPSALSLAINNGATIIVELADKQMHNICVNRSKAAASLVLHNSSASATTSSFAQDKLDSLAQGKLQSYEDVEIERENDIVAVAVFDTVEALLVHCGAELSLPVRNALAHAVQQGLQCLQLGTLSVSFPDRRLRRGPIGERLRTSPALQRALLRLATAEVLAAAKTGIMSNNVIPLRAVCLALCRLPFASSPFPSVSTIRDRESQRESLPHEASKTLLLLGQILYPSAIPMPAVAPVDMARQFLAKSKQAEENAISLETKSQQKTDKAQGEELSKKRPAEEQAPSEEPEAKKSNVVIKKSKKEKSAPAPAPKTTAAEKKTAQPVKPLDITVDVRKKAAAVEDEDSDDIPDIDMGDDDDE